jgi:hypothetical protein
LRLSAGNTFFNFASPVITLDGTDGTERLFCNEQPLAPMASGPLRYQLPRNLPTATRILVEIKAGDSIVRRSLYLAGDFTWKLSTPIRMFNRWGVPLDAINDATTAISGAMVSGTLPDVAHFRRPLSIGVQFDFPMARTSRVFYIGRRVGEIVSWPSELLPDKWAPVWAVPFGRRGNAVYCGEDPSRSMPESDHKVPNEKRECWKEVLWYNRKRITPPRQRVLSRLWQKFVEAARDA